ncbi:hypothetical protein EKK97_00960 [Billgrantia tianxiuensis]|jgi:O-antigen ligase|uniref:Uncharacterized protein n=1 Tax=Billgrantia tianxiuensis TaxID=2497861 RepID=A0A6I6SKG7_9GAMM|nr:MULTISPECIES: hypothetical protein [Halomonas]MCE8035047.1 hypothetical protein [Halomonas sp. MCCC 1A11057]QHC48450.1 hypothetical protein EKK97_00960 [Halomonas tianxiuensis]
MNLIAAVLLFFGLSLASLYVFPSGLPQPADFLLLGFAGLMSLLALGDKRLAASSFALCWALMVLWVLLVCLGWALVMESTAFFIYPAFYLFNFLVGMALLRFLSLSGEMGRSLVRNGLSIALLVAASQVLLQLGAGANRTTGSFNNPNQLAYFSLCGIVVLMLLDDFRPPLRPLMLAGLVAAVISILAASSLGAMGGAVLVGLGWVVANLDRLHRFARLLLVVPLILVVVVVVNLSSDGQVQSNLQSRMDRAPDKVENAYEERKYDRLANFPEYAILGAAEGERRRFAPYHNSEIHSSYGNMLFAYGIPGFGLFLAVIFLALRNAPVYVWMGVAGPLVYSLTHNGLRSTLFWMMLAICWHLYRQGWVRLRDTVAAAPDIPELER